MTETTRIAAALSDRYVIEREIGAGGMATVYLARDKKHDRDVALKILRADLSAVLGGDRFLNEVRITARLDHPHILTLIDSGEADGIYYYVLPYVRGESLRSKLEREKQLPLDEALSITRQIASALDYAHQQGVVHRDIKPENILLHEGEAMLADFGIALAVKEAGGNRLTETGLSLGTPQYMSPEQATGDRTLDARSDVYSLAAVLYEMLAGEPPVTGATAQAMIAKLMTERPTRLRVVRDTVPEGVDNAVAKALAKVPADRFTSAGAFHQALAASTRATAPAADRRTAVLVWGAAAVAAVALVLLFVLPSLRRAHPELRAALVLRDRTQLTFTGRVSYPAISPDGKQLAYVATDCGAGTCRYGIELQDVGGTTTRRLFDGATALYDLQWSPDRRNLLFIGSVGNRYGSWLISALGGSPRHITPGGAVFYAGGDSLLFAPPVNRPDSVHWVTVSGLDGVPRDSIRVMARANWLSLVGAVPGSRWIIVSLRGNGTELRAVDRQGGTGGRLPLGSGSTDGHAAEHAVFVRLAQPGNPRPSIVRIDFDRSTGVFATSFDTLYSGEVTRFDVTADGGHLVVDEGTTEFIGFVVDARDLLRGALPDERRVMRATASMVLYLSPDGARVLVSRRGTATAPLGVMAAAGGPETPVPINGTREIAFWGDSTHVALAERVAGGTQLSFADVRGGPRTNVLLVADSAITDMAPLAGGGWAWIPGQSLNLMVQTPADRAPRALPKPDWFISIFTVANVLDAHHLAVVGWDATYDTLGLSVVDLADGKFTKWAAMFGENAILQPQRDGSIAFAIFKTQETVLLQRMRGPGRLEVLGTIPRPVWRVTLSDDMRRAAVTIRDRHGDAWMSRVARP